MAWPRQAGWATGDTADCQSALRRQAACMGGAKCGALTDPSAGLQNPANKIAWLDCLEAAWHGHGKPVGQPAIQPTTSRRYGVRPRAWVARNVARLLISQRGGLQNPANKIAWLDCLEAAWHGHGKPVGQPAIQPTTSRRYIDLPRFYWFHHEISGLEIISRFKRRRFTASGTIFAHPVQKTTGYFCFQWLHQRARA